MNPKDIFSVFSSRKAKEDGKEPALTYKVSKTLRNKVMLLCRDIFGNSNSFDFSGHNLVRDFWAEIHRALQYRHGRFQLSAQTTGSIDEDIFIFLLTCEDEHFLDFVELMFKTDSLHGAVSDENEIVAQLNTLFASENCGYEVTRAVKEGVMELVFGSERKVIRTTAYPQVIRKDNQIIHANAVEPALHLLADPKYRLANEEYLKALEDFRKADYGDCLAKCCSAFESVMKIICTSKGWTHSPTDTAGTLLRIIIPNTGLDGFFEQPLMLIATLRNRLSTAHGAGVTPRPVSENLALYSLNSTAGAIVLLTTAAS